MAGAWMWAVALFQAAEAAWDFYLRARQHRRFGERAVPPALRCLVDEEAFVRSQRYNAAKSRLGALEAGAGLLFTAALLGGGLSALWSSAAALAALVLPASEVATSVAFAAMYLLLSTVADLPFDVYRTFSLEAQYGFNKQSPALFVRDQLMSLGVSFVLGGPLIAAIVTVVRWGGPNFWLYLWLLLVTVQVALVELYPAVIAPLFNTFSELPEGELRNGLAALAKRVAFPLTKVFVVDGSTRSAHSNAYYYGFFSNKRIVVYDTLISQVGAAGVEAVVAHELGHYRAGHNARNFLLGQAQAFAFCFLFGYCLRAQALYVAFGFAEEKQQPVLLGLFLFSLVYGPLGHVLTLLNNHLSRSYEYEADRFAVELGYDLAKPLATIQAENAANFCPDRLYSAYHFSHPTLVERIGAMDAHRAALDEGTASAKLHALRHTQFIASDVIHTKLQHLVVISATSGHMTTTGIPPHVQQLVKLCAVHSAFKNCHINSSVVYLVSSSFRAQRKANSHLVTSNEGSINTAKRGFMEEIHALLESRPASSREATTSEADGSPETEDKAVANGRVPHDVYIWAPRHQ